MLNWVTSRVNALTWILIAIFVCQFAYVMYTGIGLGEELDYAFQDLDVRGKQTQILEYLALNFGKRINRNEIAELIHKKHNNPKEYVINEYDHSINVNNVLFQFDGQQSLIGIVSDVDVYGIPDDGQPHMAKRENGKRPSN